MNVGWTTLAQILHMIVLRYSFNLPAKLSSKQNRRLFFHLLLLFQLSVFSSLSSTPIHHLNLLLPCLITLKIASEG